MASFAAVGAVGFVVDGGLLWAATTFLGWGPIVARGVSFPTAVLATWLLNRQFTFRAGRTGTKANSAEYSRYLAVQLAGAGVNLAIYALLLAVVPAWRSMPVLPLALAAGAAMIVNYLGSRLFVFNPHVKARAPY
jgi:putative flippase GtrA